MLAGHERKRREGGRKGGEGIWGQRTYVHTYMHGWEMG